MGIVLFQDLARYVLDCVVSEIWQWPVDSAFAGDNNWGIEVPNGGSWLDFEALSWLPQACETLWSLCFGVVKAFGSMLSPPLQSFVDGFLEQNPQHKLTIGNYDPIVVLFLLIASIYLVVC